MQLTPRYGSPPVLSLDGSAGAIAVPAIRQQRRLVDTLAGLTAEQWDHPSRCDGWSARDVAVHLHSVHGFWAFSAAQGLTGEPTRFLATFDPVVSPAQMVVATPTVSPTDLVEQMRVSTAALEAQWSSFADAEWNALAEAPPGHISISALVHHALWDSWIHERDILLPLGITPTIEDDEVAASLRYVAALGPALGLCRGSTQRGSFGIDAGGVQAVVDIGDAVEVRTGAAAADNDTAFVLDGDPVGLLEVLSFRAPWNLEPPADSAWMLTGLGHTFDLEV
jgi:uncharacterized protein (TIGR03083 family)